MRSSKEESEKHWKTFIFLFILYFTIRQKTSSSSKREAVVELTMISVCVWVLLGTLRSVLNSSTRNEAEKIKKIRLSVAVSLCWCSFFLFWKFTFLSLLYFFSIRILSVTQLKFEINKQNIIPLNRIASVDSISLSRRKKERRQWSHLELEKKIHQFVINQFAVDI